MRLPVQDDRMQAQRLHERLRGVQQQVEEQEAVAEARRTNEADARRQKEKLAKERQLKGALKALPCTLLRAVRVQRPGSEGGVMQDVVHWDAGGGVLATCTHDEDMSVPRSVVLWLEKEPGIGALMRCSICLPSAAVTDGVSAEVHRQRNYAGAGAACASGGSTHRRRPDLQSAFTTLEDQAGCDAKIDHPGRVE
jgi:hypothetical protein